VQPSNRPKADRYQAAQAWRTLKERGLLAALCHDFGVKIDAAVVRSVDAAGHIAAAKDRGLH